MMDTMDKYVGKLLDNRYEIRERIGIGGMAIVYKALDQRLNRYVAVKLLKEELAVDDDFRRRFHSESQAVAMLSHANIVAVYDVSRSTEVEYIVMELIEGITLKQYMQKRGILTWKEALHFSTQITKALAHAHSRDIVHRDIKPHNIMILKDSSVKVADFGIARLSSTQNTLTRETLGSVHYISPEQAKGGYVDSRTDIYSLGVVMYEMLTGRLPFEGDSAVSVAIQHISSIPLSPRELNPDIPAGFEDIIIRAMEPSLEKRYQSADELFADLEEFRKNPEIQFDYSELAFIAPGIEDSKPERTIALSDRYQSGRLRHIEEQPVPVVSNRGEMSRIEYQKSVRRARRVSTLTGIFCVIVFLVGMFLFLYNYWFKDMFTEAETIKIPNLVGSLYDDVLDNDNYTDYFNITATYKPSDTVKEGYIIEQSPKAGRTVRKIEEGYDMTVVVSNGSETVSMPNIINKDYRQAIIDLEKLGLNVSDDSETITSDTITEGFIVSTLPEAGTILRPGDTVFITVSGGPEIIYVTVPNIIGTRVEEATISLENLNLTVGSIRSGPSDRPAGEVIEQSISPWTTVAERTKVNMTISDGSGYIAETDPPQQSNPPLESQLPEESPAQSNPPVESEQPTQTPAQSDPPPESTDPGSEMPPETAPPDNSDGNSND